MGPSRSAIGHERGRPLRQVPPESRVVDAMPAPRRLARRLLALHRDGVKMDQLLTDVRYAFRTWRRSPGFALAAIATLALGIGADSTIFSVVNATLLRPIAYPQPDRLMTVWKARVQSPADFNIVSMPNYKEWQRRSTSFASMAIFDSAGRGYNLTGVAEPEQVSGVRVTASFFDVLGVPPLLGRTFRPEEEEPGAGLLVVLSHGLWVRKSGADRAVVGRAIQNRRPPSHRGRRDACQLSLPVLERRAGALGAGALDARRLRRGVELLPLHWQAEARRHAGAGAQRDGRNRPLDVEGAAARRRRGPDCGSRAR